MSAMHVSVVFNVGNVKGYHSKLSNGNVYAVLTYNSINDFAMIFSHELAELMTNPLGNGWLAPNPNNPNLFVEIADLCASETPTYVPYATAGFGTAQLEYISKLWSNYDAACTVISNYTPADIFAVSCPNVAPNRSFSGSFKLSVLLTVVMLLFWII